jgi:hypothetical protein
VKLTNLFIRTHEYLTSVQFLGFLPIGILGIVSNVYSNYIWAGIVAAEGVAKTVS